MNRDEDFIGQLEDYLADVGGVSALPDRVRDAIRALSYEGLTGTISFDSIGDLPTAKYFIIKVNATSGDTWNTNEIVAELDFASPGMGE